MKDYNSKQQMELDKACGDQTRLIYALVSWSYKKYGGDQDDLDDRRQLVRMAFLKAKASFDPRKGEFIDHVRYITGRELFETFRTKARRSKHTHVQTFTDYGHTPDGATDRSVLSDLLFDVSEDAKAILDLLFDPEPFWSPCRTVTIRSLVAFLRKKMHWDKLRVQNSLSEIEAALT